MPLQDGAHGTSMDAVALGELGHQIAGLVSSDQFLLLETLEAALSLDRRRRTSAHRRQTRQVVDEPTQTGTDQVQQGCGRVR